jgi:hypothetical protein
MKKPNLSDEEFDQLLEEAKPDLRAMRRNSPPITPERIQELKNKLEKIHPFLRILTKQQMREYILEIFNKRQMDGTELAAFLRKYNVRLKNATGEGELYGLLRELENSKLIEAEWKDGVNRRKKIYKLTDLCHAQRRPVSSEVAELMSLSLA